MQEAIFAYKEQGVSHASYLLNCMNKYHSHILRLRFDFTFPANVTPAEMLNTIKTKIRDPKLVTIQTKRRLNKNAGEKALSLLIVKVDSYDTKEHYYPGNLR